ncbi:MAG: ABC transporter ATP-binding protein/permease [Defluviitaleaceae bacterium]|nr:ABC transporter ATP-binding protein/permease [Defluviitaleaceae bacterium]MCL2275730.1 ABC transporter ATP-binding protein/permease [Defluviitaleaceae bacterium]
MSAVRWGLPYMLRYKWRLIFGQMINFINILLSLVNPLMAGLIVANVIEGGQRELLMRYLAIMISITLYRSITRYIFLVLYETTSQKIIFNLRQDIYHKLHIQNFRWFDKNRVGDTMSRMTGDVEALRHFTAFTIYAIPENILIYVAAVVVMALINVPLTLALLITTPIVVYSAIKQAKELHPAFREVREQFSNLNSVCSENIGGNRVVKAFTKEAYETDKFTVANQKFYDANMNTARVRIKYFPIMESCAALLPLILLLVGGLMVIYGRLELWQMVTVSGYLWMLNNPTRMLIWSVADIQNAATSLDKVYEMMRQEIEIASPEEALPGEKVRGDIEFKNVSFRYSFEPNSEVLKDISFTAKQGQTVGIVGATGSGKTTLMALISRFYDANSGEVLVDGKNVKEYHLPSLRKGIAYAMQDVFLYSDTVEGNIAFAAPDAPMEVIYDAAEIADAHEFVSAMPEGYETIVGERGVGLSGGQKQRISLARAIAAEPSVLILDDVTSAVDMETEHRIQEALAEKVLKSGTARTTFIVAHRLSSVKDADFILVLENGTITERGNHDELLAKNGYYAKLFEEQRGGMPHGA